MTTTTTAAELAERYGLAPSSARPPLLTYIRQLWQRRHFVRSFATSRTTAQYTRARLGQVWQLLTPLLNAGVYFVVFGIIFNTRRDVPNFTAYLVAGVFVFHFSQRSMSSGSRAISTNLGLIRALHFPRACLPLSATLVELYQLLISMVFLCGLVLVTGESIGWSWLLIIPVIALQTMFNAGLALGMARVGAAVADINQLLPFIGRTWLYTSGVFFYIPKRLAGAPDWVVDVMMANPAAVYMNLVRDIFIRDFHAPSNSWYLAVAWAVVTICAGFWYFWAAEEKYGRG